MFLEINDFLKAEDVARLRELATRVTFVDGRISNPHNQAKKNLQAMQEAARKAGFGSAVYD